MATKRKEVIGKLATKLADDAAKTIKAKRITKKEKERIYDLFSKGFLFKDETLTYDSSLANPIIYSPNGVTLAPPVKVLKAHVNSVMLSDLSGGLKSITIPIGKVYPNQFKEFSSRINLLKKYTKEKVKNQPTPDDNVTWTIESSVPDYEHDGDFAGWEEELRFHLRSMGIDPKQFKWGSKTQPADEGDWDEDWDEDEPGELGWVIIEGTGTRLKNMVYEALETF